MRLHPLSLGVVFVAACSFDPDANPAHGCPEGCPVGQVCHLGFCVNEERVVDNTGGTSAGTGFDAGNTSTGTAASGGTGGNMGGQGGVGGTTGMGGTGGGSTAEPCVSGSACYDGPAETSGVGRCRGGSVECETETMALCVGEVVPEAEACNGTDDDCDGEIDEDLELGSCEATGVGQCAGGVLTCRRGATVCAGSEPDEESCNGTDNDCDGTVDNGTDVACYPEGSTGCTANDAGGFACRGQCTSGQRVCQGGELQACAGAVTPSEESCDDEKAGDEDCDGEVDEGCSCVGDESQSCYPGPLLTAGIGTCRRGTQRCQDGTFGPCEGAVVPTDETCANLGADNDCDLLVDDIFGLDTVCVQLFSLGVCRYGTRVCQDGDLVCDAPEALPTETACDYLDEDCDGEVDEVFDLATDEQNCGDCGQTCDPGELCCAGNCIDPERDADHCTDCNMPCGENLSCCGDDACVSTRTDEANCGMCERACDPGDMCCGGECFDVQTSPSHCGTCGHTCGVGETCCGGACVALGTDLHCSSCAPCGATEQCCGGTCVARDTEAHCGGCDPCGADELCCDGTCADTRSDEDHCGGSCAACPGTQLCCAGACVDIEADPCAACNASCAEDCDCSNMACDEDGGVECL